MRRSTITIVCLATVVAGLGIYKAFTGKDTASKPPSTPATTTQAAPQSTPSSTKVIPEPPTIITKMVPSPDATIDDPSPTAAAVRFLDLDEELFPPVTLEKARALTETIASANAKTRLGQQAFDHQQQILAKGDLAGLKLRIAPISTRTRMCTDQRCTVDIYFLRLWSFPNRGALDDYATVEIRLVKETNEWRLDGSSLTDGPYPVGRFSSHPANGATAKAFEAILAGYTDTGLTP